MNHVHAAPTDVTDPNYDEEAVQAFTLPNILEGPDGVAAATPNEWEQTSRPYQFRQLQRFVYGEQLPAVPVSVVGEVERAEVAGAVPRLYLVDEMLSGTNSRERHLACRTIVHALVDAQRSFGLVTTHDLALVGIAESLPEKVVCAHFSDRFDGERLHFDYTLKSGVAATTNALYVLAMEGIDVPVGDDDD